MRLDALAAAMADAPEECEGGSAGGGATHEEENDEKEEDQGEGAADDLDDAVPPRDREVARAERERARVAQRAEAETRKEARRAKADARREAGWVCVLPTRDTCCWSMDGCPLV